MTEPAQSGGGDLVRVNPGDLVNKYAASFTKLLPTHLREDGGDQWVATVKSLLVTRPEIAEAAANGPGEFLAALVQAARKGLEPGTNEFHLVPFSARKGEPRKIQAIEGYQGIIERIYRAGAVSSVIVEAVHSNDQFSYKPGDGRPDHEVDWFGDRGELVGAYAYAIMRDGATSKVVIVGKADVERAKAKSASARSPYSPWNTNPVAMWQKTAARRLENWVPTSAEYRRQQLRDAQAVAAESNRTAHIEQTLDALPIPTAVLRDADRADRDEIDPATGEVLTDSADVVDAELVEEPAAPEGEREAAGPVGGEDPASGVAVDAAPPTKPGEEPARRLQRSVPEPTPEPEPETVPEPIRRPITPKLAAELRAECIRLGIQSKATEKRNALTAIVGRTLDGEPPLFGLDRTELEDTLVALRGFANRDALVAFMTDTLPEVEA